jgi:hypothetical protein
MATKADNLTFLSSPNGTSNTPGVLIACTTTHAAITVPEALKGKFCKFLNESTTTTDFVEFFFSNNASAEVDRTVASTAAGAQSPKMGERLYGTQAAQGRLPYAATGSTPLYLLVESSANLNLRITLAEQ